jgi:hypothetical protein
MAAARAALADSQAGAFRRNAEQARYHRRARLWVLAAIMASAALVTSKRAYEQAGVHEAEDKKLDEELAAAKAALALAQEKKQTRQQRTTQVLDAAAPTNAAQLAAATAAVAAAASASSPDAPATVAAPVVPTTFLSAAVLDVQRTLGLAPVDERVRLAASQVSPTDAATAAAAAAPAKPRKAVIL